MKRVKYVIYIVHQFIYKEMIYMFIHLGGEQMVLAKDVIAIINLESSNISESTKEFLEISEEEGFIKDISNGKPKSFVITNKHVYITPISSVTLQKRSKFLRSLKK